MHFSNMNGDFSPSLWFSTEGINDGFTVQWRSKVTAGLWSDVPFSLKIDAKPQLLHRVQSSGLVLVICFTCENQVHKTELRLKKCSIWRAPLELCLVGRFIYRGNPHACCGRCLFFSSHLFLKLCYPIK